MSAGETRRWRLLLADGRTLEADQVIAATGLRAPTRLARSARMAFDAAAGGISVDAATGATSVARVHALGDCVAVNGRASRYIEPISRQARAIAAAILCRPAPETRCSEPVLRVKTSAMPITVSGGSTPGAGAGAGAGAGGGAGGGAGAGTGAGHWQTTRDDGETLTLQRLGAEGQVLARIECRPFRTPP